MRLVVMLALAAPLAAQDIQVIPVADGVHMLRGRGGNIGVSSGPDGVFLIDDQFAPATDAIVAAIRTFTDGPLRFVLNTHWHGDHTDGNENMGARGALLVAHENVRTRMSSDQFSAFWDRTTPASPAGALPVVTFSEDVTFYLNGDTLHVFHVPHAHTDGDGIVHFLAANVIHMGDVFFGPSYPYIDMDAGGSIDGIISAADLVLSLADADTRIIPGHGALTDREGLRQYRDVLVTARTRIAALKTAGRSLEEVIAARPMAEWDADWSSSFVTVERFITFVYQTVGAP